MRRLSYPDWTSGRSERGGRWRLAWLVGWLLTLPGAAGAAQATPPSQREDTLALATGQAELYLEGNYYSVLEDPTGRMSLAQVRALGAAGRFRRQRGSGQPPNIERPASTYWLRLTVRHAAQSSTALFLELYDAHIGEIVCYRPLPEERGGRAGYDSVITGASRPFGSRPHAYKNFLFDLPPQPGRAATYYLRLRSDSRTSFRAMLHSGAGLLPEVALQYGLLGVFYGVLVIMGLYNLLLYFFLQERSHLAYALYVLSGMLLFLSEDGLGFQYLWPGQPGLNHLVGAAAPVLLLLSFATYASGFLDTARRLPALHRAGRWVVGLSAGLLVLDAALVQSGFSFWLYLLPSGLLYYAAWQSWRAGLRPARYLLLAQTLVAGSLTFLVMRKLGIDFYSNVYTVYSLNVAFVAEVVILSYALGEKIKGLTLTTFATQRRLLRQQRKKQQAQDQLVEQLRENQRLKDQLNTELEDLVARRTDELRRQHETVAAQNRELLEANGLLALQSAAIEQLNGELRQDLRAEQTARLQAREVDFGEFSQMYPDQDACLRYLADLKAGQGPYRCRKCGHEKSCAAREPYARRCTRCRYVESATTATLLQKCKVPAVKALYAVFLLHTHHGSYSLAELARVLDLRPATSWAFAQKVLAALDRRRRVPDYQAHEPWTHVLLDATAEPEEVAPAATEATA